MSKHDALLFLQRLRTDQDLVERMRVQDGEGATGDGESFVSVAAGLGLTFTEEELQEAANESMATDLANMEPYAISDAELRQVVGGGYTYNYCCSTYEEGGQLLLR